MYYIKCKNSIELSVLHGLIIEAKFSKCSEHMELSGSPYSGNVAEEVLKQVNESTYKSGVGHIISEDIEKHPILSSKIEILIKNIGPHLWNDMDIVRKKDTVKELIRPFKASEAFVMRHAKIILSTNIEDYPRLVENIIEGIRHEMEVNDIEFWETLSLEEKKNELRIYIEPYEISESLFEELVYDLFIK